MRVVTKVLSKDEVEVRFCGRRFLVGGLFEDVREWDNVAGHFVWRDVPRWFKWRARGAARRALEGR